MMRSIVEYYSEHSGYRCGYCGSRDTNYSHGMWAHTMNVTDYQNLLDRGWRRSGKYCYKPTMDVTCCPMYTIRCKALDFKASKSQKKILKRFNKYLMNTDENSTTMERKMSTSGSEDEEPVEQGRDQFVECSRDHQTIDVSSIMTEELPHSIETVNESTTSYIGLSSTAVLKSNSVVKVLNEMKARTAGPDPTKPPCKKAKQQRRERKLEKLKEKGIDISNLVSICRNKEKQVEDFINELSDELKQKLEIKLVRTNPPSPEWVATAKETHKVYVKYQTTIHNDKLEKCTESKFYEFLVLSPLLEEHTETGPECGYGSFHQQYWLNGKLIAVGVIDILPKCISSVYFFYDPSLMNLSLGTYGALREIEFTRHMNKSTPEMEYYYMGFYIHTCKKMRYKGHFYPSDLLCPETYKWFPLSDCIPKLEVSPYSRLNSNVDDIDENYPQPNDVNHINIWYKGTIMTYKHFMNICKTESTKELWEYLCMVGKKTYRQLVLLKGA
ncbi:hypothetical protein ACJJTC_005923 [Scirpophaga incertulas]